MPPPTSLPHSLTPSQTHSLLTQRRPTLHKSLALLLSSLVGTRLLVELKNSMELTGILEESDANMNMTLQQVSLTHSLTHFITHSNSLSPLQSRHSSCTHTLFGIISLICTHSLTHLLSLTTHSLTHSLSWQVRQVLPSGGVRELDVVFVNGSHVRYVHIPPEIDAVRHLNEYVSNQ